MLRDVVIVGASLAGLRAAETMRTQGFEGGITLVGAESHLPYDRPPLSKKVLAGEWEPERITLRKPAEYGDLDLTLRLGCRAIALDVEGRVVELDDGDRLPFDGVILATGAAPRRLPGQPDLHGIVELRSLDDALALRAAFDQGSPGVVVIGAGFIGAEVAATAREAGLDVTIVEALPVPLVRGLGEEMGGVMADLHRSRGVDLRLGTGVAGFEGATRVEGVRLSDGSLVPADVVVVGIGVAPATGWLETSGLTLRDGVVCDETLAAGPPGVYAAGDLTRWPNPHYGEEMRVEHWTNANEQGALAARNLLETSAGGSPTAYAPVPFFWSDQYDARIQFLGRGGERVQVVHGDPADHRFVALYGEPGDQGRVRGVLGVNLPRPTMGFRKLLMVHATWEDALAHAATLS